MRKDRTQGRKISVTPARATILCGTIIVALAVVLLVLFARKQRAANPVSTASYVGADACAECHADQAKAWRTSHHAKAMQIASESTVLGNFADTHFTAANITAQFLTKNGKFYVNAPDAAGKRADSDVTYTFGIYPLQQYLVPFAGGRLQSFVVAWDSRNQKQDGQRWFDLYPSQKIAPGDPLHWTGRNQTWNYMCADCHSTNLRKNYDLTTDSYHTTWSEIDVSCESCHGPGSNHIAWARSTKHSYENDGDGLVVNLRPVQGRWAGAEPGTGTLHWQGQTRSHAVIDTCAPCHSRRHPITSDPQAGRHFLDNYVPSLLEEGVYYPDGQILEEDYEWGSFLQSKMYHEGVNCSDCHDPHTAKLRAQDLNSLCGRCHSLAKFDSEQHHHHKGGSAGALCVNCHMPARTYMVVDARRDHSLRVPRPDFSIAYGTPNACNACHQDKSSRWAEEAVVRWYGPNRRQEAHFVSAIDAGRRGLPNAEKALSELIEDASKPGIARATGLSLLPEYLTPASLPAVQEALQDQDALVRAQAVSALQPVPVAERVRMGVPLLSDPVRSVRIEAARLLAGTQPDLLSEPQKTALDHATAELIASEMTSAERPENHMNLALLYVQMGRYEDAENQLKTALRLDPKFVPAMVNLADLYRMRDRDDEGQKWLERATATAPEAAEPIYALGLLKVRQKQYAEAALLLEKAARLQPSSAHYAYVYAAALNSMGNADKAISVLQDAHRRRPADRQVLIGLISFEQEKGNISAAIGFASELVELTPGDPKARQMLGELTKIQH